MRYSGSHVLVTGTGSNGIGNSIARRFSMEGAAIAAHYRSRPAIAEALVDDVRAKGGTAIALQADLGDPKEARRLVREAAQQLGGLDILVHAAAMILRKPAIETSDADWARIAEVNLGSAFACATEAAKVMIENKSAGRIVLLGSVTQVLALAGRVAYGATKGGVAQLARGLALELAPAGITVNVIAPGTILTDMNRGLLSDPERAENRLKDIPVGRFGVPDDIAEVCLFLASPNAGYVTGQSIFCDGGMSLP